ncbi:MAG: glycosyltransferase family 2 protein [Rhodospirillaceae bacterium]
MNVTIAIVSYNSTATLGRCFRALAAQTEKDFRVLLIDNASRERPGALANRQPFPVDYRELAENIGFAGAMNVALAACETPFLVALNPDAFPAPDWLALLLRAAHRHPTVAAFGSLQLHADDPSRVDGFGDHYLIWGQAWRGTTRPAVQGDLAYCFGVCAAAALYRAETLRRIGGFDERFFCFYEDVDVAFRLRLAGEECAVVPTAVVHHVGGASFEGLSDFAAFLIARNQWWVLIKNMPFILLLLALPGFILLQIVGLLKNPASARMKGLAAGLARSGEFLASRRAVKRLRAPGANAGRWISWNPVAFLSKRSLVKPADCTANLG